MISTTPSEEPRWPPVAATVRMIVSRISVASCSSSASERPRRSAGPGGGRGWALARLLVRDDDGRRGRGAGVCDGGSWIWSDAYVIADGSTIMASGPTPPRRPRGGRRRAARAPPARATSCWTRSSASRRSSRRSVRWRATRARTGRWSASSGWPPASSSRDGPLELGEGLVEGRVDVDGSGVGSGGRGQRLRSRLGRHRHEGYARLPSRRRYGRGPVAHGGRADPPRGEGRRARPCRPGLRGIADDRAVAARRTIA